MSKTGRLFALLLLSASLAACATSGSKQVRFVESVPDKSKQDFLNWPVKPLQAEQLLAHAEYEIMRVESVGSGTTRPTKGDVRILETGDQFTVKGKTVPKDLDGINNSPRKELAAWKIQTLFLDPADYTVPATALRCIPHERQLEYSDTPSSTLPGTKCLLREATIWMQHVAPPDELYEEERFLDNVSYAYHMANFNIFAYLINLRDNRSGNVLVSKDEDNRRVFAVDNGVAFGTIWYNWFYPPHYAWRTIRVPALPRNSINRLRELRREDLDFLMVVAQMETDSEGVMRNVDPGPPIDPDDGTNFDGATLQLGLTADEVNDIWERIESLIKRVDAGKIALF